MKAQKSLIKKSAKENISKLPDYCYSVLLTDKTLIKIVAGESGYYKMQQPDKSLLNGQTLDEFVNELNNEIGVNLEEREAMEIGSMFGWDCPGSNIENYIKTL